MTIFEFSNYKHFVRSWLKTQPKAGWGFLKTWSVQLGVSSTLLSQVFNGEKELSAELASDFCDVLSLSEAEADYFLLLVEYARAGTHNLRARLLRKIKAEQKKAENVGQRLKVEELPDHAKAIFYSHWLYSGIRNLTAISKYQNVEALAEYLKLPRLHVQKLIEFLLNNGLCVLESGQLNVGPKRTHLAANSPFVLKHHQNWRLEGFQKMPLQREDNLFFTFPMSLSEEDAHRIRAYLPSVIEHIHKIVGPSNSEVVRCLNIDFFEY